MGYDAQPFKVRPCRREGWRCDVKPRIETGELPDPGVALDPSVDHWHILPRGGGDNRNARDLEKWKSLLLSTSRCEHGRTQEDVCASCPGGWSPSQAGKRIGTTMAGKPIVVPPRERYNNIEAWTSGEDWTAE